MSSRSWDGAAHRIAPPGYCARGQKSSFPASDVLEARVGVLLEEMVEPDADVVGAHEVEQVLDVVRDRLGVRMSSSPRKSPIPLTPTTPPVAAHARACSSRMFRSWSRSARGLECEKMTGARESSIASMVVR